MKIAALVILMALFGPEFAFAGFGCWIDEKIPVSLNEFSDAKEVVLSPDTSSPNAPHIALSSNMDNFSIWNVDVCQSSVEVLNQQGETIFVLQTTNGVGTASVNLPNLVFENSKVVCPCHN